MYLQGESQEWRLDQTQTKIVGARGPGSTIRARERLHQIIFRNNVLQVLEVEPVEKSQAFLMGQLLGEDDEMTGAPVHLKGNLRKNKSSIF